MLVDTFGRVHKYLRISLTNSCNFACNYCMPPSSKQNRKIITNELNPHQIGWISNFFISEYNFTKIRLTGGEPTVRHDFHEICEEIYSQNRMSRNSGTRNIDSLENHTSHDTHIDTSHDAHIDTSIENTVKFCLTTNALKLNKKLVDSTLFPFNFHYINISLDTLSPQLFSQMTNTPKITYFSRVMNNILSLIFYKYSILDFSKIIDSLVNNNIDLAIDQLSSLLSVYPLSNNLIFHVKLNIVVQSGFNYPSGILDMIKFFSQLPVQLRLIEFMPFDKNDFNFHHFITVDQIISRITSKYKIIRIINNNSDSVGHNVFSMATEYSHPLFTIGIISSMSDNFCNGCDRVRISSTGDMRNCLFSKEKNDDKGLFNIVPKTHMEYCDNKEIKHRVEENIAKKFEKFGGAKSVEELSELSRSGELKPMIDIGG